MDQKKLAKWLRTAPIDALAYLQSIYNNSDLSEHVRVRAASIALPFEKPKLSAMALVHNEGDFAERLDKAIERAERVRINGNGDGSRLINSPKVIDAKVNEIEPHEPEKVSERAVRIRRV
jgi:hypothetical protein